MAKIKTTLGIEFDDVHIRAVRVQHTRPGQIGGCLVEKTAVLTGSYSKDEEIVEGLKQIRDEAGYRHSDGLTACMAGKQQYVGQFPFRKVPRDELDSALRFEIKKHIPFDTTAAAIEYQVVENSPAAEEYQIVAAAVQRAVMKRFLSLFAKAGMEPTMLDVLPLTLANAYQWSGKAETVPPALLVHIGPGVSTLVFAGDGAPFFSRSTYFTADELYGPQSQVDSAREKERRLTAFSEEVSRSLNYYLSTYRQPEISAMQVAGEYGNTTELMARLQERTGLEPAPLALLPALNPNAPDDHGAFALATALALRSDLP